MILFILRKLFFNYYYFRHYEHRRYLRATKEVLRNGKLVPLSAEHDLGWHTHVLAFARYTNKQLAIIAINFNDAPVNYFYFI